ncbi:MAG: TonB-dependent receptor, partial [Nitrospirae bacterium]
SDTAKILKKIPGANVNSNGPLTGIPVRRGQSFSSGRVNVLVDGMYLAPACANYMDTPLSHISPTEVESIEVTRGIAPVSSGIETFDGSILVKSSKGHFGKKKLMPEFHGSASAGVHSVSDTGFGHVTAYLSNKNNILRFKATREDGDDIEFDGGEIHPTEFERDNYTIGYSFKYGNHEIGIDFKNIDIDDSGTPSLPMDLISDEEDIFSVYYKGQLGMMNIDASFYDTDGDHLMDNYTLRHSKKRRFSVSDVKSNGYKLHFQLLPTEWLGWQFGFDVDTEEHNSVIRNPDDPTFFVINYHDASKDRYSVFTEWDIQFSEEFSAQLGFRFNHTEMDSDRGNSTIALKNPFLRRITERFNSTNRNRDDNEVDGVLKLSYQPIEELTLTLGIAQKTRTPLYQERYLYVPLESTAGLADGKRYVGKVDLNPEINHKIEFDISYETERFYFRPNFFYSRIHDYIQGVPAKDPDVIAFSTANGDPSPLQFENIAAKYYGFDGDWGIKLHKYLSLDGTFSYVRGKRRGSKEDNLYRIPPFNAINTLTFSKDKYKVSLETVSYARQRKVSKFNQERRTAGYTYVNI